MSYSHKPITLDKLSCVFIHKTCFEDFSTIIHPGDRIAIIGPNGSGKTTLLKILAGIIKPTSGSLTAIDSIQTSYVAQMQPTQGSMSGGEQVQKAIKEALELNPNLLLLDEPTNHLDATNREELFEMLHSWRKTAIIVTHDTELLRSWPTKLWHLDHGKIIQFHGSYDDLLQEQSWAEERSIAQRDKLIKEQKRLKQTETKQREKANKGRRNAKNAMLKGSISRLAYNGMKENAEKSSGAARRMIENKRDSINQELSRLSIYEELIPEFNLPELTHKNAAVMIREGTVNYGETPILTELYLNIQPGERHALMGDNGSGKSTLFKALLNDPTVTRTGSWSCPSASMIGHIDQHYSLLKTEYSVFEMIKHKQPIWEDKRIRKLLNDFLFRSPEEIATPISALSGGERARLALACIVAQAPSLLLLDEITNNLDRVARQQIIDALSSYHGTLIIISHDNDFIEQIEVTDTLVVSDQTVKMR